jgi:hypothetical protein
LTVDIPDPQPPELVVVVAVASVTPGTTRTSSTKSSFDRYVLTVVVQAAPFVNVVVTVDVLFDVLNAAVSRALIDCPNAVVATSALVGYVRQAPLEPPPEGPLGFPLFDESPVQAVTRARLVMNSSVEPQHAKSLAMLAP